MGLGAFAPPRRRSPDVPGPLTDEPEVPPIHEEEAAEVRRLAHLAAFLFALSGLLPIPSIILFETGDSVLRTAVLVGVALCSAIACIAVPWERMGRDWLNVIAIAATLEIGVAMAIGDVTYRLFLFFVAIFVGYAIRSHAAQLGHLALAAAALLAPVVYDPGSTSEWLHVAILYVPSLLLVGGSVAYLREQLERKQRMYLAFAEEAYELVGRIRDKPPMPLAPVSLKVVPAAGEGPIRNGSRVPHRHGRQLVDELILIGRSIGLGGNRQAARGPMRPIALGATIATLPLLALFALALAGVPLPRVAQLPFEAVGIELPNQEPALTEGDAGAAEQAGRGTDVDAFGLAPLTPIERSPGAAGPGAVGPSKGSGPGRSGGKWGQGSSPGGGSGPPSGPSGPPGGNPGPPPGGGGPPGGSPGSPSGPAPAPGHGATPPGHGGTPPGQSATPPGQSATPPGHGGTPPGQSATPPGHGGTPPGQSATPPGQSATPPGHGGSPPGHSGSSVG